MKVEPIPELDLDTATEAGIAALLETCFDGTFEGRSFFSQRHHLRLVARESEQIAGHIALGLRAVRLGAELVDVATIAEVATLPAYRGKGIASRLLAGAVAIGAASPARFLLLFGKPQLYERAGFVTVRNPIVHVDMRGAATGPVLREPSDFLMVRPLGDAVWDGEAVLDLLGSKF